MRSLHDPRKATARSGEPNPVPRAALAPLLPGAETLTFIDSGSMQKRVCGYHKQGTGFGHAKIHGKSVLIRDLNALTSVISTPQAAPVISGTRLRGGRTSSARAAAPFAAAAMTTTRGAGCTGTIVVRMDPAFYGAAICHAVRRQGALFSLTARRDPAIRAAITAMPSDGWTPIRYPRAIRHDQLRQ
jgi:hypothetical protein